MAPALTPGRIICKRSRPIWAIARSAEKDFHALADWLLERALEHDKPTLLYELTCEKLRTEQLLRPGVTRLERLVAEARARAADRNLSTAHPAPDRRPPAVA